MENVRKRLTKEAENNAVFGIQKFAKSLLDVADTLHLALSHVKKESLEELKNPELKIFYDGVNSTERTIMKVFNNHGIKKITPVGEIFNENFHQAVVEVEDANKSPGTIAYVIRPGYLLDSRVLRPAEVAVVKAPNS